MSATSADLYDEDIEITSVKSFPADSPAVGFFFSREGNIAIRDDYLRQCLRCDREARRAKQIASDSALSSQSPLVVPSDTIATEKILSQHSPNCISRHTTQAPSLPCCSTGQYFGLEIWRLLIAFPLLKKFIQLNAYQAFTYFLNISKDMSKYFTSMLYWDKS